MPTPTTLLNTLRAASAYYMMSDNVRILRSESWSDEYGGVYTDYTVASTTKARLTHRQYQEEPIGGGITNKDEYYFIFEDATDIRFEDRVEIVNDPNSTRYYLVVGVDDVVTQGIFRTAKVEVNYN
jgi:hypothetical protein